jgi:aspartate ammonia-lyase
MRTESDFLGTKEIKQDALYGINALRAKENFPDNTPFHIEWYKATGLVKLACYLTLKDFKKAVKTNFPGKLKHLKLPSDDIIRELIISAKEISEGKYFEHFIVPAMQGGAGTAANMNINEIICNSTLLRMGKKCGQYELTDPFETANIYQSTNDVMPTALKAAAMFLFNDLEESVNKLRGETEKIENKYRNVLRIAYTQMQAAVPSSYGMLWGGYNEMLSRDWWRISKCFERIKTVNIGGGAAGSSLSIPTYFVMQLPRKLQEISKLPIHSSENLQDATSNLDALVEVHAILKAHAVNLEKMAADLRLLASGIIGNPEIMLPDKQTGSSVMPGKVNPVIPEFVISCAQKVQSNDMLISSLAAKGNLDLNPYLPTIGHALLESIKLLIAANNSFNKNLMQGLTIQSEAAYDNLYRNPSVCTALNPYIGYADSSRIAEKMKTENCNVFEASKQLNIISEERLQKILSPDAILKAGFSIKDLSG